MNYNASGGPLFCKKVGQKTFVYSRMGVEFCVDFMYIMDMKEGKKLLLMAVFWDLPKFRDEVYLQRFLEEQKGKVPYYWAMTRFLEYGRIVDTFSFFSIDEIAENISNLQLSPHTLKRWKRMIEVYGANSKKYHSG